MPETKLANALNFMFETAPVGAVMPSKHFDFQTCCELVINKLDSLAEDGLISFTQASMAKNYLPYCEVEDLLMFILGYKGFITESFNS